MRFLAALLLMSTPALAHTDTGFHAHPSDGIWIAAIGSVVVMSVVARAVVRARARVKVRT